MLSPQALTSMLVLAVSFRRWQAAHLEAMVPTVERALDTARVKLRDVDAIAVTAGPGLTGALLVGVAAAKSYALALDKPIYE